MGLSIERLEILLLIAAIAAMLARRARLPYTVVLVVVGAGLAFTPFVPEVRLTRDLIFVAFLPPLVFEAAYAIPWPELKRDLPLVLVLATLGVALAAAVTTVGMRWAAGWPWASAVLFGVLISATDPVSVIATFREARAAGRLRLLVESESLMNDGTAAVAFAVALAALQPGVPTAGGVALSFVVTVAGGVACGALAGVLALLLIGRSTDHLVEITLTTVAAYGSFLVAERFHLSGVLAALTAGLVLGNSAWPGALSDRGREAVESFWEYAAFVVNSLVFLLMGMRVAHERFGHALVPIAVGIVLVVVGRAAAVYPCCALFTWSRRPVPIAQQHVLFWGGLRGALALALVLALPADLPRRGEVTAVAFAIVAFSVIVQGLTIAPLMRRLGERGEPSIVARL